MCPGVPGSTEGVSSPGQLTHANHNKADRQTSSRKSASMWLCHVHNLINARLGKADFDCLLLDEVYDCGCGPDENPTLSSSGMSTPVASETQAGMSHEHQDWE